MNSPIPFSMHKVFNVTHTSRPGYVQLREAANRSPIWVPKLPQEVNKKDASSSGSLVFSPNTMPNHSHVFSKECLAEREMGINRMFNNLISSLQTELKVFAQVLPPLMQVKLRGHICQLIGSVVGLRFEVGKSRLMGKPTSPIKKPSCKVTKRPLTNKKRSGCKTVGSPANTKGPGCKTVRSRANTRKRSGPRTKGSPPEKRSRKSVSQKQNLDPNSSVPIIEGKLLKTLIKEGGNLDKETLKAKGKTVRKTPPHSSVATPLSQSILATGPFITSVASNVRFESHDTPTHVLSNTPIRVSDEDDDVVIIDTIMRTTTRHSVIKCSDTELNAEYLAVDSLDSLDFDLYNGPDLTIDIKDDEL